MKPLKYGLMFFTYVWLRLDPVLRLAFGRDWTPRYEFMANIFGETDADKFLNHRVKLLKARNKPLPPLITPKMVDRAVYKFLRTRAQTKTGQNRRLKLIEQLIFWATDQEINQFNIDSYQTRSAIVDALLNVIFQNSLISESELILRGLKKIVFSRVTYRGAKGEPSPVVHDVIIAGSARILLSHFNELVRLRDQNLDKLTKVKLIKELQKAKGEAGSLAFSAEHREDDEFKPKFPLPQDQVKLLLHILKHYQFSAWPDSRDRAKHFFSQFERQLGFKLNDYLA